MKKTYLIPAIEVTVVQFQEYLLAGSVAETLDNTDASQTDDFIQLSREGLLLPELDIIGFKIQ